MKQHCLISVLIFFVTGVAFLSAAHFGLAPCDDPYYVANGPAIQNGLSFSGLSFALTDVDQGIWMPLSYLSFMLDYSIGWGFGGMHIQSIFWHGINAVLFYFLLLHLFKNRTAAILAALFWSIHPLRVESVVWIASRKDVLSTFFLLCALSAWLKAEKDNIVWIAVSIVLFTFGVMAKPSIMVFTVFAIAIDFLVTNNRKDPRIYYALIGISILIAYFASWQQSMGGATQAANQIPIWYRLMNAVASLTVYLGNIVWPRNLAMQCMIRYPDLPRFNYIGLTCLICICAILAKIAVPRLIRFFKTQDVESLLVGGTSENVILAACVVFFGSLVPFLGIVGFGIHAFADRFTILPTLGLSMLIAYLISKARNNIVLLSSVTLFPLWYACYCQTQYWRDNGILISHTLEVDRQENSEMQRTLALHIWENEHDMEKVYVHLKKAYDSVRNEAEKEQMASVSCHFLIEACYDTGRADEAEDLYYWFRKINNKIYGNMGDGIEFMMAEVLFLLNSNQHDGIAQAEEILNRINLQRPGTYIAANIAYRIALKKNDKAKIRTALELCAQTCQPSTYCKCLWAKELLKKYAE